MTSGWVNEIRFASLVQAAEEAAPAADANSPATPGTADGTEPADGQAAEARNRQCPEDDGTAEDYGLRIHTLQGMSRDDFIAALRAGLFGSDVGGLPPGGMFPGGAQAELAAVAVVAVLAAVAAWGRG